MGRDWRGAGDGGAGVRVPITAGGSHQGRRPDSGAGEDRLEVLRPISTYKQAGMLLRHVGTQWLMLARFLSCGWQSSSLVLDGSDSVDPDSSATTLTYNWTCTRGGGC